jgi:hypothetical protein
MLQLTDVSSEVHTASIIIALMMVAVYTSETPVIFNLTIWCYIPEDSKLQHLVHLQFEVLSNSGDTKL